MKIDLKCFKCGKKLVIADSSGSFEDMDFFLEPCNCCEKGDSDNAVINILKANNATLQEKFTSMQTAKDLFENKFNSTRAQLIKVMDNMPG